MMPSDTLPPLYRPLMDAPSMRFGFCPICGRVGPLEQHHMVWRSWGKMFDEGKELPKPTITLCGFGNNLPYCHGLAHHRMLHFKYEDGALWYLLTEEPTRYMEALLHDGWRIVNPKHTR